VGLQFSAWSKYLDQYVDEARYDTRTFVMPVSTAPRISIADFTPLLDRELILHPLRVIRRSATLKVIMVERTVARKDVPDQW
jgi:hypothetical protein